MVDKLEVCGATGYTELAEPHAFCKGDSKTQLNTLEDKLTMVIASVIICFLATTNTLEHSSQYAIEVVVNTLGITLTVITREKKEIFFLTSAHQIRQTPAS